jgi:hypothetical protein
MHAILAAIVEDDRAGVRKLIKADPGLATSFIGEARLFESKIVHWIYVGDTALHLAARQVTALNLFDCCWPPEPTQTRQGMIGKAAPYTMRRMATSTALAGMPRGKCGQSNACSMPEPTLMARTKTAPRLCIAPRARDAPPL